MTKSGSFVFRPGVELHSHLSEQAAAAKMSLNQFMIQRLQGDARQRVPRQARLTIGIDFDGTLAEHRYPKIGDRVPGGIEVCNELQQAGHRLILVTMRGDKYLEEALQWCAAHGFDRYHWYGVNTNPEQREWTTSPKAHVNIMIDDVNLGCPLIYPEFGRAPYVNWVEVRRRLVDRGLLEAASNGSSA